MVIAESRYIAEDAIEDIWAELEPLDAVVDLEKALDPDAPLVHDDLESNLAAHLAQEKGDYEAAREQADLVVKRRIVIDRGAAGAMENRGIVAHWEPKSEHLTLWDTTQAPIPIRNGLAAMFGLSAHQVRVIAPFVGGGFGPKIMLYYPEEVILTWATLKMGRPIKWIEDRRENFFATTQERGQVHYAEMALTAEGRILGIRHDFLHDTGAYDPYGLTIPLNTQSHAMGAYDVPNYCIGPQGRVHQQDHRHPRARGRASAGHLFGGAAHGHRSQRAGHGPARDPEARTSSRPTPFPTSTRSSTRPFRPLIFDSGNYIATLEKAAAMIGYEKFVKEEQPRLRAEGKHVGLGIVPFVETTGVGPYEGARVTVETDGQGERGDRRWHAGAGTLYLLCPDRGRPVGREPARCAPGDRRHGRVPLGDGHLCLPGRGGRGQRHPCRGRLGPEKDPCTLPARSWRHPRKNWSWWTATCGWRTFPGSRSAWANWRRWPIRCVEPSSQAPSRAWKPPITLVPSTARRQTAPTP